MSIGTYRLHDTYIWSFVNLPSWEATSEVAVRSPAVAEAGPVRVIDLSILWLVSDNWWEKEQPERDRCCLAPGLAGRYSAAVEERYRRSAGTAVNIQTSPQTTSTPANQRIA